MSPPRLPNAPPPPIGVCPWGYKLVWGGTQWVCAQLPNAPPPPQFRGAHFGVGDVVAPHVPRIPLGGSPTGLSYRPPVRLHPGVRYFPPGPDEASFDPYAPQLVPLPAPGPDPGFLPTVPPGIIPELPPPPSYTPPMGTEVPYPELLPAPPACPPPCDHYDAEELMRQWVCACPRYCP